MTYRTPVFHLYTFLNLNFRDYWPPTPKLYYNNHDLHVKKTTLLWDKKRLVIKNININQLSKVDILLKTSLEPQKRPLFLRGHDTAEHTHMYSPNFSQYFSDLNFVASIQGVP
jgi:hypothetical protein